MQKVARTLIAGLLVSLPSWAQNVFPPANSTITQMRPSIGCDWGGGARNLQLIIDGRDWTQEANKNGGRIDLNPIFDVGYGTHTVESRATGLLGLPVAKTWTFTIVNPNGNVPVNSNNPATRTYPLADSVVNETRPRISADFPENLRAARAYLDGQEVPAGINGNNVAFTPQVDLSRGTHQVSTEVTYLSGARVTQNWTFNVRPTNQGNNNNLGNGQFTNFSPPQNGQVNNSRPLLSADFGVVMDNLRIYVDKNEVTNQAQITSNRISWNPTYDLNPGLHWVRLEGRQTSNNQFVSTEWQFEVNGRNGGWNNNPGNQNDSVNFGVDSPSQGARVSNSFRVSGSARPDATVRISVKPLPNKNKVASFSGKADARGYYSIPVAPTWATRGQRLEVTTTMLDRRGRVLADPVVIQVIRR
ncbi:MAG: hypothetical protein KF760_09465 [Candidatus Eremiobacteraeota bacterium]|nr:hypothetical protein [Candidatus Eremiobacteraeota bacterium]MCW5866257.1 hypothetical protein [Candidatus Eremiobacteraeota bacterium]